MLTPPRRRWFQFGLRELFWLTLVVALGAGWIRERSLRHWGEGECHLLKGRIGDLSKTTSDNIELATFYRDEMIKSRQQLESQRSGSRQER